MSITDTFRRQPIKTFSKASAIVRFNRSPALRLFLPLGIYIWQSLQRMLYVYWLYTRIWSKAGCRERSHARRVKTDKEDARADSGGAVVACPYLQGGEDLVLSWQSCKSLFNDLSVFLAENARHVFCDKKGGPRLGDQSKEFTEELVAWIIVVTSPDHTEPLAGWTTNQACQRT